MQGDDAHRRAGGKFQAPGIGPDVLQASAEGDLDLARAGDVARNAHIDRAAMIEGFGKNGRSVGAKPVERVHQPEVSPADKQAGANAAERRKADGKAVLFQDRSSESKPEQHG